MLVLYPLKAVLCTGTLVDWWRVVAEGDRGARRTGTAPWTAWSSLWKTAVVATLLLSVGAQVFSVDLLRRKQDFSHRLNEYFAARPEEYVITNTWTLPQSVHQSYRGKQFFLVDKYDWRTAKPVLARLKAAGVKRVLLAEGVFRRPPVPAGTPHEVIDDRGLMIHTVRVVPLDLR
jgi:hypothetical protein